MNRIRHIRQWIAAALLAAASVVFVISLVAGTGRSDVQSVAREMSRRVEKRLALLDGFVQEAAETPKDAWMTLDRLPNDMVVYRYVEDTLQSWANQFPIRNDDIRTTAALQRLGDTRSSIVSPLQDVPVNYSFANHGPKWYLEKCVEQDGCKIIAGLEIVNELQAGSISGINPRLRIDDRYTVRPLSAGTGAAVSVAGRPLFKLTSENAAERSGQGHSSLIWLALGLALAALSLFLTVYPTLPMLAFTLVTQGGILSWMYLYGRQLDQTSMLFSPLLYAGSPFLYSLGAVILVNLAINLLILNLYLVRWTLLKALRRRDNRVMEGLLAAGLAVLMLGIGTYLHLAFRSILINSNINLELYIVELLTPTTGLVYLSFLGLAMSIPLLLQMMSPLLRRLTGVRYDVSSTPGRLIYAAVLGAYFVITSATLGFQKEQQRIDVWANRLAMDRDIALEIQLRSVEGAIAADPMIGALSVLEGGSSIIRNRLSSTFMSRISQEYDIGVVQPGPSVGSHPLFQDRIRGGVRLGDNSHFFYSTIGSGRACYTGLFTYYVEGSGAETILITVESKHNREDRGYLSMLGISDPGRVSIPPIYSRAKYRDGRLVQYKGAFPYPTILEGPLDRKGWRHFMNEVSEGEVIIISRPATEIIHYVVAGMLLSLIAYFLITMVTWRRRSSGERRYYRNRIGMVIYISLTITLIVMSGFSVWFVNKRGDADLQSIMTARINTLQSMLGERLRQVQNAEELSRADIIAAVEGVGNNLRCDITLFDIGGSAVMSTTPEVYDRLILGHRLNDDAYYHILYAHERFYLHREQVGRRRFYALYAPVFNSNGSMVTIVSSPFTDITHDLETEAALHVATIITIFLLLLMISRFITTAVVGAMFRPITEMRRKMTVTDVDHLEPILYTQDDEIMPLVQAYNRMVRDLGESSRRLTQAERDKAWTDMARRVAHDLKNPLTPIKLQLQMLIRMKASGNPAWQDRFDEVAQTVLYHVDLLADSADQFSTFAKMYDQAPERLDLDALVRQEVDLFDARDDVQIEYLGLPEAWVTAPRPQLTRVVVNLITNAIQAVEENSGEKRITVAVRNAPEDGFYDIVVSDNGPGVSEQNQDKIFTPDFTTKTSGSGLGLAICRRIIEHCGGSISYSRSFTLGGACFTVKYPKE